MIIAAPDAVSGLADNGRGASVMGLIGALPPKSQAAILAAPDEPCRGLADERTGRWDDGADRGAAAGVAGGDLLRAVPDAVWGLAYNGQGAWVIGADRGAAAGVAGGDPRRARRRGGPAPITDGAPFGSSG